MRGFFFLFFIITGVSTSNALNLTMNDVSVLLPLPALNDDALIFNSQTKGAAGDLVPPSILRLTPPLAADVSSAQFRALAFRFDPCFGPMPAVPRACHAQIRIVWQPLRQIGGETVAVDAAIHTFYELTDQEMRLVLTRLQSLSSPYQAQYRDAPLTLSPIISKQGFSGTYWAGLSKLILAYTGQKRLSRLTFMTTPQANQMWDFGGFDLAQGRLVRTEIPRLRARLQVFINKSGPEKEFTGGARAPAGGADTLNSIITESKDLNISKAEILKHEVTAVHRIENPLIHSPQTIDCVSCHVAQAARVWAIGHFADLKLGNNIFKFESQQNLRNFSRDQSSTVNLRAFGYFGRNMAISQRTINETARLIERLNQLPAAGP